MRKQDSLSIGELGYAIQSNGPQSQVRKCMIPGLARSTLPTLHRDGRALLHAFF